MGMTVSYFTSPLLMAFGTNLSAKEEEEGQH